MFKIKYEEYHNDYDRKNHEKKFLYLSDLEEWIFGQMQRDYTKDRMVLYFPGKDIGGRVEFQPVCGGATFWIHLIEDNDGILFSDGTYTAGQKFTHGDIQEWFDHCRERQEHPKFRFVKDGPKQADNSLNWEAESVLGYLMRFLKANQGTDSSLDVRCVREQARALFTTVCMMGNIDADTAACDRILAQMWEAVSKDGHFTDREYFFNYMLELIV